MARPFVYIGTILLLFTLLFYYTTPLTAFVSIIISLIILLIFQFIKTKNNTYIKIFTLSVLIASVLFCGKYFTEKEPQTTLADNNKHTINGTLTEYPQNKYDSYYYILKTNSVDNTDTNAKIRLKSDVYINCEIGDTFTVNNAVIYTLENQTPKGYYIGCYTDDDIAVSHNNEKTVYNFFLHFRTKIKNILQNNLNTNNCGIILGMLTGDTSLINNKTLSYFRYSGISHIFAVSGLHLSLWITILFTLIGSDKKLKLKGILSLIFVLLFFFIAGFSKSVLRAGIMNIVFSMGLLTDRKHDSLNSLFIAVTILIFINPFVSADMSFLMSFLSCFGLITYGSYFLKKAQKLSANIKNPKSKLLSFIMTSVIISITVTVFLLPIYVIYQNSFPILSPVTNLLCLLPSQILMVTGTLAVILSPVKLSYPLFFICEKICDYLTFITNKISSLSFCNTEVKTTFSQIILLILFTIIIILSYFSFNSKRNLQSHFIFICAFIFAIASVQLVINRDKIKITVPDTGNGSYIILKYKQDTAIIGCGGNENKEYDLNSFLNTINTPKLSLLLIPRNTDTESFFTETTISHFDFKNSIITKSLNNDYIIRNSDNTISTDKCTYKINDSCIIEYNNTEKFSYAYIKATEFNALILFKPVNNLSVLPIDVNNCNILITRSSLGKNIDLSKFGCIILQTEEEKSLSENMKSTKKDGNITIDIN